MREFIRSTLRSDSEMLPLNSEVLKFIFRKLGKTQEDVDFISFSPSNVSDSVKPLGLAHIFNEK